ncbi:MAG TPA: excinuclease ABC subunit UvrA [Spirochaetia bacterium]|nr:excinuclease ABC subunit UvrA [Spirochaetia bacterium]
MAQEYIEIKGARENNLKNVSLRIPKRKITVFTGVSGSGKSSLVFDTIAMEAQRLLSENFSTFLRGFMPRYPQPAADSLANLNMAVVIDQKRLGGGSHSTVGTITDIYSILRLLFSRAGTPSIGGAHLFSFNDPNGMCPECNGLGRRMGVNLDVFLDETKSLKQGALLFPEYAPGAWGWNILSESRFFDMDKKVADFSAEERDLLLYGKAQKVSMKFGGKKVNLTYEGAVEKFTNKYIKRDLKTMSERTRKAVEPFLSMGPCGSCKGARLSRQALGVKVGGYTIAQLSEMEVDELVEVVRGLSAPEAQPILEALESRLTHLCDIGLEYLSLDRETDSLSGGESARVKMVKHLTSSLVDVTYIFDEPSVGLHPRDVHRLNELLEKLRDKGNTVLVIEHDPAVIRIADHVVDLGPAAGRGGGEVVFEGSFDALLQAPTLTGRHLQQVLPIKSTFRKATGTIPVRKARANNLKNVSVDFPRGVLTVVTGVAGSGKSSLVHHCLVPQHPDAVVIDQSPVGANSRSNPATYTGIMDSVRKAFAAANKVAPALFSFNSKGACERCQGLGVIYTDLAYLDEVKLPCEVCGGKRFKDEVLGYKLDGKSISDVLEMSVAQALEFFTLKDVVSILEAMRDVGLDYLGLGQPLSTLSGGECQRIKLAGELHKEGSLYIMDEPTTGLHMSDIARLLQVINRIVDEGNTMIVIEHNLDVIRNADWIVDLGPEGGHKGGTVLFEGTPRDLKGAKGSLTAKYLA